MCCVYVSTLLLSFITFSCSALALDRKMKRQESEGIQRNVILAQAVSMQGCFSNKPPLLLNNKVPKSQSGPAASSVLDRQAVCLFFLVAL